MYFVVTCRDGAASAPDRAAVLAAHRDHVDRYAEQLVLSGPLLEADGQTRCGQLFVLDVATMAAARQFADDDPFTAAGIFESVRVGAFLPIFRDGRRV